MAEGGLAVAGAPGGGRSGCGSVLGLRIPADTDSPVALVVLALTASALSAAIGGGLLEDALTAEVDGGGYTFYVDEFRVVKDLALNDRAGCWLPGWGMSRGRGWPIFAGMSWSWAATGGWRT